MRVYIKIFAAVVGKAGQGRGEDGCRNARSVKVNMAAQIVDDVILLFRNDITGL